jgi:hypothetical protein
MDLPTLEALLEQAWSYATTSEPARWTPENAAWGQCAITACVVQDYFGGDIVWCEAVTPHERIPHYYNIIDGATIDLTRKQFPVGTIISDGVPKTKGFPSTRALILSYPTTKERYELLKRGLEKREKKENE